MSMFCYQCQETSKRVGCQIRGVCGKNEEVAKLQDLLIYSLKGIADVVITGKINVKDIPQVNHEMLRSLFITITNANFDDAAIEKEIDKVLVMRDGLKKNIPANQLHDCATFTIQSRESMLAKADTIGVLSTENEDIRSLRELITYGLKGMAAYSHHALNIRKEKDDIYAFLYEALAATLNDLLTADELVALTIKTGQVGLTAMALLDEANTSKYGNPQLTTVNLDVRSNPAILISGHDLTDLEQLMEQTQGTGVDVYTHCEMLPAHYYPALQNIRTLWVITAVLGGIKYTNLRPSTVRSCLPPTASFLHRVKKYAAGSSRLVRQVIQAASISRQVLMGRRISRKSLPWRKP